MILRFSLINLSILLLVGWSGVVSSDDRCPQGDPIGQGKPPSYTSTTHKLSPSGFFANIEGGKPTNRFFVGLGLGKGETPIVPLPYTVKSTSSGLIVNYPKRAVDRTFVFNVWLNDISLEASEVNSSPVLVGYDDLSATLQWKSGSSQSKPTFPVTGLVDGSLIAPLVQGAPYITMKYGNLTPLLKSQHAILNVNGQSGQVSGTKFRIALNNGQTWILYALDGSLTLNTESGNTLRATGRYSGVLRVALELTEGHQTVLDAHSSIYPIAGCISYCALNSEGTLRFHFTTEGSGSTELLHTALPHHKPFLKDANLVSALEYISMKGKSVGVLGSEWTMRLPLSSINFFSPREIEASKKDAVRAALMHDKDDNVGIPGDTYSFGKVLSRYGRLALIAEELGEMAVVDQLINKMKDLLQPWVTRTNGNVLLYDQTWGGIISKNGREDAGADYGMGWYNDKHFHFGYFIYGAAIIARRDSSWAATYAPAINDLIRDFANPTTKDTYFGVSRMKDWYAGHSWASGLFEFGDAKNQESTSESVNGYYSVLLWGLATNDTEMASWGQVLMMTEIISAQKYWQMKESDDDPVYEQVFRQNKCVGILWGTKVDYATWFGANVEYIHGIQFLPFTPITELLLVESWVHEEYPVLAAALTRGNPPLADPWKGFIVGAQAIIDKQGAWTSAMSLNGWDNGNSKTNLLHWIATRP